MFKKPASVVDIEDIGSGGTKHSTGQAVSNKRKRCSNEYSESQEDSQGETGYRTWREILGPPPPTGTTRVRDFYGLCWILLAVKC